MKPRNLAVFACLVIASFGPGLVTAPVLGLLNLVLLTSIWLALIPLMLTRRNAVVYPAIILASMLMAFPPSPYYIYGDWSFYFIGFDALARVADSVLIFFMFYFLIFYAASRMIAKRRHAAEPLA